MRFTRAGHGIRHVAVNGNVYGGSDAPSKAHDALVSPSNITVTAEHGVRYVCVLLREGAFNLGAIIGVWLNVDGDTTTSLATITY